MVKQHRNPFITSSSKAENFIDTIYADVCGPMTVDYLGGPRFFLTFTDNFLRFSYFYTLKNKNEVFEKPKVLANCAENLKERTIKSLRSDNGANFFAGMLDLLKFHGNSTSNNIDKNTSAKWSC